MVAAAALSSGVSVSVAHQLEDKRPVGPVQVSPRAWNTKHSTVFLTAGQRRGSVSTSQSIIGPFFFLVISEKS